MQLSIQNLSSWPFQRKPNLKHLIQTREQLHQAAQLPALVARTLLPADTSDAHAALRWGSEEKALLSQTLNQEEGLRVGLRLEDLTLLLLKTNSIPYASFELNGNSYPDALDWLSGQLESLGFSDPLNTVFPYEIPDYDTAWGEPFSLSHPEAFTTFAQWYDIAFALFAEVRAQLPEELPIRTWPHHFDMAILHTTKPHPNPEKARSIGFGFSPGDEHYNQPYFYLNPWPYPPAEELAQHALDAGHWHTKGFSSAILTLSDLIDKTTNQAQQAERLLKYVNSAWKAGENLVG